MPAETEKKRKPREKPAPYARKAREPRKKHAPKTAAKPAASGRHENLTLADWMNAFKFPQIVTVEENLLRSVEALKARNRVFGAVPSIEELVNSKGENQALEDSPLAFLGGDHDIVEQVVREGRHSEAGRTLKTYSSRSRRARATTQHSMRAELSTYIGTD